MSGEDGSPLTRQPYDFKVGVVGRCGIKSSHKLFLSAASHTMRDAIVELGKRIDASSSIAGDDFVSRIETVKCNDFDLWEQDCQDCGNNDSQEKEGYGGW